MGEKKDISIYWALSFLFVVGLTVTMMNNSQPLINFWINVKPIVYRGQYFFITFGISIVVNFLLIVAIFERIFGYKKQGSRLRSIHGDKEKNTIFIAVIVTILIYLIISFVFLNSFIAHGVSDLFTEVGQTYKSEFLILINTSFSITFLFLMLLIFKIAKAIRDFIGNPNRLSKYPESKNQLILGSVGEEKSFDAEEKPRWVKLKQKALNGNILVTGSIGSGKTQGTILVFVDQILKNFTPRPSMLILDPKGTFIPEVRTMATAYGLQEVQ